MRASGFGSFPAGAAAGPWVFAAYLWPALGIDGGFIVNAFLVLLAVGVLLLLGRRRRAASQWGTMVA